MNFLNSVEDKDVHNFFQAMNLYIKAGIPEHNAIEQYAQTVKHPKMKEMAEDLVYSMENGMSMSQSMEKHPEIFSALYIKMVSIGELSGQLDRIIAEVLFYVEQKMDIDRKLSSATLGPKISAFFIIIGFFVAATYVIPQFAAVLKDLNVELPLMTKIILGIGDFFSNYWWAVLLLLGAIYAGYIKFKQKNYEKIALLKFKLPLFSTLENLSLEYTLTKLLGLCLSAGIQIEYALKYTALAMENPYVKEVLINASNSMTDSGKRIDECIAMHDYKKIVNDDFMMIMHIGAESGDLTETMLSVSEIYRKNYLAGMENFSTKFSTIVLIPCAVAILTIYISILYPMYSVMNATNSI